jgi:hypothetical protein
MFQKQNISVGTFTVLYNFKENEILELGLYTHKLIHKLQSLFVYFNTSTIHSVHFMMLYSLAGKYQCLGQTRSLQLQG